MRRHLLSILPVLLLLGACGTTPEKSPFVKPNALMGEEIENRIAQIPYLHRSELVENLMWLVQTGEQAIPAIVQALDHESPKVRSNAAWVLGQMGDRRTIPFLQPLAQDEDLRVRLEAARTLVLMGDMAQSPALIEGLDSERNEVRFMCHEALKTAASRDFGYDHLTEDIVARNTATYKWRQWWSEVSGDPWFAKAYAQDKGLIPGDPATPEGIPAAPGGETAPKKDGGETKLKKDSGEVENKAENTAQKSGENEQ